MALPGDLSSGERASFVLEAQKPGQAGESCDAGLSWLLRMTFLRRSAGPVGGLLNGKADRLAEYSDGIVDVHRAVRLHVGGGKLGQGQLLDAHHELQDQHGSRHMGLAVSVHVSCGRRPPEGPRQRQLLENTKAGGANTTPPACTPLLLFGWRSTGSAGRPPCGGSPRHPLYPPCSRS